MPRIRIYVSSTYRDLREYREMVNLALQRLGHEDMAMELYVAEDKRPLDKCLQDVTSCDVYVGIFAWRYGYVPQENNPKGRSITELEYRKAKDEGKPRLIFLSSEEAPWPMNNVDEEPGRIQALRRELMTDRLVDDFANPDELTRKVNEAVTRWANENRPFSPAAVARTEDHERIERQYLEALYAKLDTQRQPLIPLSVRTVGEDRDFGIGEGRTAPERSSPQDGGRPAIGASSVESAKKGVNTGETTSAESRSPQSEGVSIGERLQEARRLVVLGDPGFGKSMLIDRIAFAYLRRQKDAKKWQELPEVAKLALPDEDLLPVIVRCRDLQAQTDKFSESVEAVLQATLKQLQLGTQQACILAPRLILKLEEGTAVLMIDGLDEIREITVREDFCRQLGLFVHLKDRCRVVVTSRPSQYREMNDETRESLRRNFEPVRLCAVDRKDKIAFIHDWYNSLTQDEKGQTDLDRLESALRDSRFDRITSNPMLLTLVPSIFQEQLEPEKGTLSHVFYKVVQKLAFDWDGVVRPLSYVAFCMHEKEYLQLRQNECVDWLAQFQSKYGRYSFDQKPKDFLNLVAKTGLFKKTGLRQLSRGIEVDVYEFSHLMFQEYFACRAMIDQELPNREKETESKGTLEGLVGLVGRLSSSAHWREVIRLVVSTVDEQVDELLLAIATPLANDAPDVAAARATLAVQCLADVINVSDDTVEKLFDLFLAQVSEADGRGMPQTAKDHAVVEIAISRHEKRSARFKDRLSKRYWEQQTTATLGCGGLLAMMGGAAVPNDPDRRANWFEKLATVTRIDDEYSVATCALTIMGAAFWHRFNKKPPLAVPSSLIDALFAGLGHGPATRRAATLALFWLNGGNRSDCVVHWGPSDQQLDALIGFVAERSDDDPDACGDLVAILGRQRPTKAVEPVIKALSSSSPRLRREAARALGEIGDPRSVDPLLSRLRDKDPSPEVRREAILALGRMRAANALEPIVETMDDPTDDVRVASVWALGQIGTEEIVNPLSAALRKAQVASIDAAYWLGETRSKAAVAPLGALILQSDIDLELKRAVARALARIATEDVVPFLMDLLQDNDASVKVIAATALGQMKSATATAKLIERLIDNKEAPSVRSAAASSLGLIKAETAVQPLIEALDAPEAEVRLTVAQSLFHIGERKVVKELVKLLNDPTPEVRKYCACALGRSKYEQAVEDLTRLLQDKTVKAAEVRLMVIWALGEIGCERAADELLPFLRDSDEQIQTAAVRALARMQSTIAVEPLLELARSEISKEMLLEVVEALGELRSEGSLDFLIERLARGDREVKRSAASAAGKIQNDRVIGPLNDLFKTEDVDTKVTAIRALARVASDNALSSLIPLLGDAEEEVRRATISALEGAANESILPQLIDVVRSGSEDARYGAATLLTTNKSECSVKALIDLLREDGSEVNRLAAQILGFIKSIEAIASLAALLDGEDRNREARLQALWSLGAIGSDEALAHVLPWLHNEDPDFRKNALAGIGESLPEIDDRLLSRAFDRREALDPRDVICESRIVEGADKLDISKEEVRARYEALADRFPLQLEWR
jgi:HEAT repeat protein